LQQMTHLIRSGEGGDRCRHLGEQRSALSALARAFPLLRSAREGGRADEGGGLDGGLDYLHDRRDVLDEQAIAGIRFAQRLLASPLPSRSEPTGSCWLGIASS
jgi:hypothetical protein